MTSIPFRITTCSFPRLQNASMPVSTQSPSVYVSQNIYDECNKNLSKAQQRLKLDHDCLGHIGFQHLQHLHTQERQLPEFDGVPSAAKPCFSAKNPKQIFCQAPVCATCTAAHMCKCSHGAKHSKPDAKHENIPRSGNLKPGSVTSVDQCKSSVRSQLPST